jgi:uncharacterized membrane protein YfcA
MLSIDFIVALLALGAVVGFMAGLLGIGGGGIMVPILTSLFLAKGIPVEQVVHLALGTSMAAIVVTSFSSLRAHHHKQAVAWPIFRHLTPGVIVGTFVATFIAAKLNSTVLAVFFAVFMAYVSLQMFVNKRPKPSRQLGGAISTSLAGTVIGVVSALVSIGGGSLTVPYLSWHNIDIKKAIGTSAAVGFPLSIAGTLGYIINGWNSNADELFVGFIYLPAVVLISVVSFVCAPLGASMAHRLPVALLKKIFALLLIGLSVKMLWSVIG